jgi:flagellar basal-body rod modification protein FlgD
MTAISSALLRDQTSPPARPDSFSGLGGQEFLRLLIAQLTTQDPLEPTGNQELLQQIASIRDIELSTTLTESLRGLTGDQRFGSASALIGKYVIGTADSSGVQPEGLVSAVRFEPGGRPVLQLANGAAIPLDQVVEIHPPEANLERMRGMNVVGLDRRQPGSPVVQGVVADWKKDENGDVVLELDSGHTIKIQDVLSSSAAIQ